MASKLVVLAFDGPDTASEMLINLREAEKQGVFKLDDAVIASRGNSTSIVMGGSDNFGGYSQAEKGQAVKVQQTQSHRGRSTVGGIGVGLLAGLLVGGPIVGVTIGIGALAGALRDRGIKDSFIEETSNNLKPDSSALFLLIKDTDQAKLDGVLATLHQFNAKVLYTDLPAETEQKLRDELAGKKE
jgi:uncharacterized membrane protein